MNTQSEIHQTGDPRGALSRREFIAKGAAALGVAGAAGSGILSGIAASAAEGGAIVSPKAFAHIAVRTRDVQQVIAWHKKVLGIRIALDTGRGAFSTFDEEHHRISYFPRPAMGEVPKNLGGFDHMALSYNSVDELIHNYRRLKALGITPHRSVEHGPVTSMYYLDPTGLAFELLASRFESKDDLENYIAGGCLLKDPKASDLDPEKLIAKGSETPAADDVIRPSALSHTVLKTTRYEKMIEWYQTALGCRIQHQNERACFLSYDGDQNRIAVVNVKDVTAPGREFGFDHYAYEYNTMRELAVDTYIRLKEKGILPYWTTNHGMTTSFYYADPDLNRVELQVDNFKTKAECWEYITGPDFAINFIGVDVDPGELAAMVNGGASYEEMHGRVEGPRTTPVPSPYGAPDGPPRGAKGGKGQKGAKGAKGRKGQGQTG